MILKAAEHDVCIPGMEIDRHTEPLTAAEIREKWQDKVANIKEFIATKTYKHHYGFPTCTIPIVTINLRHMRNIMELFHRNMGPAKELIFKTTPDWAKARSFPKPNGEMLTSPWYRLSDLAFDDKKQVVALKDPSFCLRES